MQYFKSEVPWCLQYTFKGFSKILFTHIHTGILYTCVCALMDGWMGNEQAKVVSQAKGIWVFIVHFVGFEIKSVRGTTFPHAPKPNKNIKDH